VETKASLLPSLIKSVAEVIEQNSAEVTKLDQAIGDGDHVFNLQRGLKALIDQSTELEQLDWSTAFQKIGMTLMSTMGGASGSLFGTLFLALSKATPKEQLLTITIFSAAFSQAVEAVKKRGKADAGEKTMLDVLIPVVESLQQSVTAGSASIDALKNLKNTAIIGVESTRDMLATKGRASFLGERSRGHIDAGAKTSQLMICTIADLIES